VLANPGGAGEGSRNQVRFALRLLGSPCLGSLQREVQGRSTARCLQSSQEMGSDLVTDPEFPWSRWEALE